MSFIKWCKNKFIKTIKNSYFILGSLGLVYYCYGSSIYKNFYGILNIDFTLNNKI